jgi:acyl homoserine lactone synthase
MMEFLDVEYSKLTSKELRNLLYLRKLTFKDRLHWQVSCRDDMEFDDVEGWCF